MIAAFGGHTPQVDATAFVVESAVVIGDVVIGSGTSIWFNTVLRGDVEKIRVGARTNIQDNATVHVTTDRWATIVGDDVTVGHAAILHGCTVGNRCLIGMGAIVLDGVVLEDECLVAAGAVVTPGTRVARRSLIRGSPARVARPLRDDEVAAILEAGNGYVARAAAYRAQGVR